MATMEKSIDIDRKWASAYPREYLPHAFLAFYLRLEGEFQNAIDEARESIRLNPYDYHAVFNLMIAEMAMERPDEAKAAYDEARSRNVDAVSLRNSRYRLAFLQRDEASMQEQQTWAAGKPGAAILLIRSVLDRNLLRPHCKSPRVCPARCGRGHAGQHSGSGCTVDGRSRRSPRRKLAISRRRTNYYALWPA